MTAGTHCLQGDFHFYKLAKLSMCIIKNFICLGYHNYATQLQGQQFDWHSEDTQSKLMLESEQATTKIK